VTQISYTNDKQRIKALLEHIDSEFFPPLSVQVGEMSAYLDRLLSEGKVVVGQDDTVDALFSYFIRDDTLECDTLWISPNKRSSSLLYRILAYVVKNEQGFEGSIQAKTWSSNSEMVDILKRLGFELKTAVEGDYIPERTTLVFETDSTRFRRYFR